MNKTNNIIGISKILPKTRNFNHENLLFKNMTFNIRKCAVCVCIKKMIFKYLLTIKYCIYFLKFSYSYKLFIKYTVKNLTCVHHSMTSLFTVTFTINKNIEKNKPRFTQL